MKRLIVPLTLVLPVAAVPAQEGFREASATVAERELESLLETQRKATAEYNFQRRALEKTDEYRAAVEARDRDKLNELQSSIQPPDTEALLARFQAAAEKYEGTPAELDFVLWIATNAGDGEVVGPAVDVLLERHVGSEKLVDLLERYFALRARLGEERAMEVLDEIALKSPSDEVRAWALYAQAQIIQRNRDASDEDKLNAETMLARATELAPEDSILAMRLAGPTFEAERLEIGMEAPDIVGEDLDGVPFKLSDYRGKVVVLDFWGDW